MSSPRKENIDISGMTYVEEAQWRLFKDIDDSGNVTSDMQILMLMGDRYTVLDHREFRRMAERILAQLPQS